jgi:hypothetical protein
MMSVRIGLLWLAFGVAGVSRSQGIYTEFGQNRVQYERFRWMAFYGEKADLLYSDTQLRAAASFADRKIAEYMPKLENLLGYKPSNRPQFLIYGSLSDYKQNNIGYVNPQWQSGGITFIPAEALPVYLNGDYAAFSIQIKKGLCDFVIREMVFGGTLQDRFERLKSPALPYWFTEGLSSLIAEGWNSQQETELRDGFLLGSYQNFNLLSRDKQLLLGRSIWKYIIDKHGVDVISGIMFIARYTHSAEAGISYYSKNQLRDFLREWKDYYAIEFENKTGLMLPKGKSQIPGKINKLPISGISLNEDGKILSMITHDNGKFSVWLYFTETGKTRKMYDGGQKVLNQINDYTFPKAKWKGNKLHILTFEKGVYQLLTYSAQGKLTGKLSFQGFKAVNDFALHPKKDSLIFSAVNQGIADIYKTSLLGGVYSRITHDDLFEDNLLWIEENSLLYTTSSSDNVRNFYKKSGDLTLRITDYKHSHSIHSPVMLNDTMLGYLSDVNGLQNAWFCNIKGGSKPLGLTNYGRSVSGQAISGDRSTFAEILKLNNRNTVYTGNVNENPLKEVVEVPAINYSLTWKNRDLTSSSTQKYDRPIPNIRTDTISTSSDSLRDGFIYQTGFPVIDYPEVSNITEEKQLEPKERTNLNPLLPDYIVTQLDNRNLVTYLYDNQVPASVMRNPWLMPYLKISLSDLQRNTNLEAGCRANLDLTFTDFYFKSGFYAGRLDHEILYYRRMRKFDNEPNLYQQYGTQLLDYRIMRPVDERLRFSYTAGWRQDAIITKITEKQAAEIEDNVKRYWTNRLELLFDNSISSGLNHVNGSKVKLGMQHMFNLSSKKHLYWLEFDARYYRPLWQSINLAQRFSGAYNLGRYKTGYYLGGVENWTQREQLPDNPVFLNPAETVFQTWICNLRGFYRGARIGHSYFLSNTELRWTVMKMSYRRPLASEFLKHFTITAFADAGCAFTGNSPADAGNPYNTVYLNTPNYIMSITSRRNPWLVGLGYGVRSRVLGYFVKYDRATGWQEGRWNRPVQYISLGLDF